MADAQRLAGTRGGRRWIDALPLLLLLGAMLLFAWRAYDAVVPSFYGLADEHGYLTTAKRLATRGEFAQRQPDPYAFVGETMMQSPKDPAIYYLRQPIGYPLLCAAAYFFGGSYAPFVVNPLLGLALIGGAYAVGKELGSRMMGAGAALAIALHPLILYYTVMALSHVPDMAAATWTMAFALMWRRERRLWQAAAAGGLCGIAVLIRYTNLLLLLPLAVVLLQRWWAKEQRPRRLWCDAAVGAAAFVVMLIPLAVYQSIVFGGILRTGYSAGGNATGFSWAWFMEHAPAMAAIVLQPGTGLNVLLISVAAGIGVLAVKDRWTLALLLAWALPPLVAYTAYYGMPARNPLLYARFALCGFVPLIMLGTLWPAYVTTWKKPAAASAMVLAAAATAWNLFNPFMAQQLANLSEQMLLAFSIGEAVQKEVPPGSLLLADDFTYYFLDYIGDYRIYNPAMYRASEVAERLDDLNRSPHEFDPARTRQLAALLGGKSDAELTGILRQQLAETAKQGRGVYLVTLQQDAPRWAERLEAKLEPQDDSDSSVRTYRVTFSGK